MNILLVEPNHTLGGIYRQALAKAGHEVSVAKSAQAAVYLADKSCPDVVVLEMQLPGHSGVEFLYEFRSYPEWQDIPVVLHTFVAEQDLAALSGLNVAAYLYKPAAKLKQLVRTVGELMAVEA